MIVNSTFKTLVILSDKSINLKNLTIIETIIVVISAVYNDDIFKSDKNDSISIKPLA